MRPADRVKSKALAVLTERSPRLLDRLPERNPIEAVFKRNRTSKTFDIGGNVRHLSQTVGPQHYLNGSQWEEIDLAFQERSTGFVSDKSAAVVTVFKDRIGWRHESRQGGWWAEIELIEVDGRRPAINTPTVNETNIVFPNVAEGVEIDIVLLREGAEAFKNLMRPAELVWRITQSENSQAKVNTNPKGKDTDGNALEMVASFTDNIYRERWTGRVSKIVDPATRKKGWTDNPVLPVRVDASITENVVSGADDVFERGSLGSHVSLFPNTTYFRVGRYANSTRNRSYFAGVRFQTLSVPVGAIITAGTLTVKSRISTAVTAKIYGDDVDDAAAWGAGNLPRNITKTTAFKSISPGAPGIKMFDVLGVVQELFARVGWASGNDIRFGFFPGTSNDYVDFEAFEAAGDDEPQLDITYTTGGGGGTANNLLLLGVG